MEISDKINCNTCKDHNASGEDEPCASCIDDPCNNCYKKSILRNYNPRPFYCENCGSQFFNMTGLMTHVCKNKT